MSECKVHSSNVQESIDFAAKCTCGEPACEGATDGGNHQCGGPSEACMIAGCPECGTPDLLQGCAVIRCSHCGCPSVQEPGHDYCQTCARSVSHQRPAVARFVDAWSKWALSSYVCTDTITRDNLRTLRAEFALDEFDGSESWEVSKFYEEMIDARAVLDGE